MDQEVLDQIEQLLKVHAAELKQKGNSEKDKSDKVRTDATSTEPSTWIEVSTELLIDACLQDKDRGQRGNRVLIQESMDDMELDEEKKSLITREIDKFRDAYKVST